MNIPMRSSLLKTDTYSPIHAMPQTRVGFGRVQNLFLPGQWKKLEETCFFQFWTGFVRPSGRNLSKTWTKPISTIWWTKTYLSGQTPSKWTKPIWVDETYLSGQNPSEWTKPIWVDKTHLSGQNLSGWTKHIWVDETYMIGQNLSDWTKPIWVDKTHLSGRNLYEWTKPIWVDVHSDRFLPLR